MARKGENIYHRKDGRWEGRYIKGRKINGKPKFGYVYGKQYIEVKRILTVLKAEVTKKPASFMVYRDGTLEAWVDFWLEIITKPYVDISTYHIYKNQAENHIVPKLGGLQLGTIREEDVQGFINEIKKRLAPGMLHNVCRLLKSILTAAKDKKLIAEVPFGKIRKPQNKPKRARVLSIGEQERLEKDITQTGGLEYLLCLYTGLRLGEVCALKWEDIDFAENMLYVNHTLKRIPCFHSAVKTKLVLDAPKTESSRREIPVPAFLMWKLKQKMADEKAKGQDFIFQNRNGDCLDPRTLQKRLQMKFKKLKIRDAHFHTLRHTFATRCLEKRIGIETLSELLGHSTPQITIQFYAHCTRENKIRSIRRLKAVAC